MTAKAVFYYEIERMDNNIFKLKMKMYLSIDKKIIIW